MIDKCMTLCIKNDLLFAPAFFGRIAVAVCSGPGNGIAMHIGGIDLPCYFTPVLCAVYESWTFIMLNRFSHRAVRTNQKRMCTIAATQ